MADLKISKSLPLAAASLKWPDRGADGSPRFTRLSNGYMPYRPNPYRYTLIPAVVAIFALAAAPAVFAQSARTLVRQGNEAYQKEEYSSALESYEKAAEQAPDSPRIWFNRGSALYKEGQYDKAMDAFEQAALSSDDPVIEALSKFSQGNTSFRKGVARLGWPWRPGPGASRLGFGGGRIASWPSPPG